MESDIDNPMKKEKEEEKGNILRKKRKREGEREKKGMEERNSYMDLTHSDYHFKSKYQFL